MIVWWLQLNQIDSMAFCARSECVGKLCVSGKAQNGMERGRVVFTWQQMTTFSWRDEWTESLWHCALVVWALQEMITTIWSCQDPGECVVLIEVTAQSLLALIFKTGELIWWQIMSCCLLHIWADINEVLLFFPERPLSVIFVCDSDPS